MPKQRPVSVIAGSGNENENPQVPFGFLHSWSPGEMHGLAVREIMRAVSNARGNHERAVKSGLARLQADGLVTPAEVSSLNAIVEAVHSSKKPKVVAEVVRTAHDTLLLQKNASDVALVIASIAVDSVKTLQEQGMSMRVAQADVGGAISGANVGSRIGAGGGVGGAIAGAVIGGIVGGAVASASAAKSSA